MKPRVDPSRSKSRRMKKSLSTKKVSVKQGSKVTNGESQIPGSLKSSNLYKPKKKENIKKMSKFNRSPNRQKRKAKEQISKKS